MMQAGTTDPLPIEQSDILCQSETDNDATDFSADHESVGSSDATEINNDEDAKRLEAFHDALVKKSLAEHANADVGEAQQNRIRSKAALDKAREYQQELFERAKEENVIAVLDTGMGKTLIAAMLIRHILEQDLVSVTSGQPQKHVFFLANNVPLVHQQARYLSNNLPVMVQALTGADSVDKWNKDEWQRLLSFGNVIVCTAAVLEQALFHNYVRMGSISLIIFDEAHHCKKNHPYSRIIKDYFLKTTNEQQRPRLFSMTASPVDSKRSVAETIVDLEELLNSKVVTVTDANLVDWAYKPVDKIWEYGHLGPSIRTPLWEELNPISALMPEYSGVGKDLQVALRMSSHLGTWFSDRVLRHVFGTDEVVRTLYGKFERSKKYGQMTESERGNFQARLFEAPTLTRSQSTFTLQPEVPYMSPKVKLLHTNLDELFRANPSARAMVFVEERWTAVVLCDAFKALNVTHLHPGFLTGGGSSGSEVVSARRQEETMRHFNAGVINILFTTSVGEEGIDIPQCNIVVRFDPSHKTIQYIQSRGRARMKDSIYAHMVEQDNVQHREDVRYIIEDADYIKAYCQQLPSDRMLGKGTKLAQMLSKESSYHSFETSSGVCCNFSNCLVILSRYASSLYHIGATTSEVYELQETQDDTMFQYIVRLPVVGESTVKGARGESRPNKILARRSAAYNCVLKLRMQGLLDENLDSKFKRFRRIEHRMAVSEKKEPYGMIVKPQMWSDCVGVVPELLHAVTIEFRPAQPLSCSLPPLVLLTRAPMPDFPPFPVYLENDIYTEIITKSVGSFPVKEDQLEIMTSFTLNAVFADVFHKEYEPDASMLSYWVVPQNCSAVVKDDLWSTVDFSQMQASVQPPVKWMSGSDASEWCGVWLVDPLFGRYRYISEAIVHGVSIHDDIPAEMVRSGKKKPNKSIFTFTDSHWGASQSNYLLANADPEQPVLRVEESSLRRNFLDKAPEKDKQRSIRWVAPEPLQIGRLSLSTARSVRVWPSIIHRFEAYLIVLEGLESLGLDGISADLALEAFTKDNNIDDQEAREHATKARGMGKNYERLEFIGDSLLKMTSTISVYNRSSGKEGDMHDRRKYVLCNDTLWKVSKEKTHMYRYIRSSGFQRDFWYPEHMVLSKGKGVRADGKPAKVQYPEQTHALGKKTIADVSEATIGACVMSCKDLPVDTRFDLGVRAISILTDSEDHRLSCWADFSKQHTFQSWQLRLDDPLANSVAASLENKIGYSFNYPRLARSAFTHPSEMNSPVPDYQRLEFLGDACFDWVAIWWLFITNPTRNPEWLTEHKMAMVSNQFLAALAVLLDFDKLLFITNVKMKAAISEYASECRARRIEEGPEHPDFWRLIKASPPKALADLVEATMGAILVDSNFNYAPLERFFTTHVQPFFVDIDLYDGYANKHPTSLIHKVINGEYGCRQFRMEIRNMKGERVDNEEGEEQAIEEGTEIMATVFVHTTALGYATGTSARYAKMRASKVALGAVEGLSRGGFREKVGCFCGEAEE